MKTCLYTHNDKLYYEADFVLDCVTTLLQRKKEDFATFYIFMQEITVKALCLFREKAKNIPETLFCANVSLHDMRIPCEAPLFLAKLYNELAKAHKQAGKVSEAERDFRTALSLDGSNVNARYNLAELFFDTYNFSSCAEICQQILQDEENHVATTYLLGLCMSSQGKPHEALPFFQKVAHLDNEALGAHYWTGECLLHDGNYSDALPYFKRSYELSYTYHKESARGYAICELVCGDANTSLEICDRLLAQDPTNQFVAMQIKGDALISLGRIEEGAEWHRDLARIELDARDFVIGRGHRIAKEFGRECAKRYVMVLLEAFPDMYESFSFLDTKNIIAPMPLQHAM